MTGTTLPCTQELPKGKPRQRSVRHRRGAYSFYWAILGLERLKGSRSSAAGLCMYSAIHLPVAGLRAIPMLFSVSFQLSFAAVTGIATLAPPMSRLLKTLFSISEVGGDSGQSAVTWLGARGADLTALTRIHRRTPMDGVRKAEGGG